MAKKQANPKQSKPKQSRSRTRPKRTTRKKAAPKRPARTQSPAAELASSSEIVAATIETVSAPTAPTGESPPLPRITNCNVSLPKAGGLPSDPAFSSPLIGSVPTSDRRAEFTWPIGDQQGNGACVGWAVGDGLLRWHLVHHRGLSDTDPLSVRYFWMAAKEMDEYIGLPTTFLEMEGTSIWAALKLARQFGCLKAAHLPADGPLFRATKEHFLVEASRLKIGPVQQLEPDLDQWARWLAEQGPLAVRLTVDANFELASPGREFLSVYTPYPDPWNHGHAAVLVGYVIEQGKPWFIVRNSWGQTWGRNGHAFVSREYVQASFTEAWGVRQ